jgi:hypothetical protein
MARFRRRSSSAEEGIGWIYADLFLALTIVGLGSAVITTSSPSSSAEAPKVFQLSCAEFSVPVPANLSPASGGKKIESAIGTEIANRGWAPESSKPGFAIVMGGFSGSEGPGAGDGRAKAILGQLRKSSPLLSQIEMRTAGARSVRVNGTETSVGGAGSHLMVVYLLFSGPQLSEDCTR